MAALGYITHADENRRQIGWLIALYVLSFEMIGGMIGMLFLPLFDPQHVLLVDPIGYFLRYGVPMALVACAMFLWLYSSHADAVTRALDVKPVSRIDEPRLVQIAEEQCMTLGIRLPRFGLIEVDAPNAITVGEGPERGMIAVTRGLLEALDDDELAAVIAHEASHIRNGDTRVLAANHALMRTAVILQVNNALRFEDIRQLILPLFLPPFLLIMLLSGSITMSSMKIARMARRSVKLSRDHIADGEAVRATHRPDALHSALRKVAGKGGFPGSTAFDELLFDGRADAEGGTHPAVVDRLTAITTLGRDLMQPGRMRRDSRANPQRAAPAFGRKVDPREFVPQGPPPGPKRIKPKLINNDELLKLMFSDWAAYRRYNAAIIDWYEWREDDKRDLFGMKQAMRLPVAVVAAFLLVLHWPSDGDYRRFAYKFSPQAWSDIGSMTMGTFDSTSCSTSSGSTGNCSDG